MTTVAPYGTWESPISAADLAAGSHPVAGGMFVGDQVWWAELRPDEGGRTAIRRAGSDGEPEDLLPAPWNARTRVHEYGGGAWTVTGGGAIVFAEFSDQRLYRHTPGGEPTPLTPEPAEPAAERYGELTIVGDEVWCVRERHAGGEVTRDLAAVPLDGSAACDPSGVRSVVGGSHFLAAATVSPDGGHLAWLAWEHPQMPWDGTELRIAELVDGVAGPARTLLGSATESVLQPEWLDDATLLVSTDRSGWWNLHRVPVDGSGARPIAPMEAEVGAPLWQLGARWFTVLDEHHVLFVRTRGTDTLGVLDLHSGDVSDVELAGCTTLRLAAVSGPRVLVRTAGARVPTALRELDLDAGGLRVVRADEDGAADPTVFADARPMTFASVGGREVHAVVYPPHNPGYTAPEGELPPYVAFVHGGPTSHVAPMMAASFAYFTSRGIGVVDVNYGGSTGYGREYRERLRGEWGVVDVEDTIAAVRGLADAGLADGARLAIQGGSAGGWTVLSALTTSDAFACGVSYFGVAELELFAAETHDFESRYLDGLLGPLPEARQLYRDRAPVNNVDGLSCPVLLLQGLDDPVVPPSQAERFRDAMLAKGIPHAYRTYEGESHGFRRRETLVDSKEAELSFYGQVLGFDPPGITRVELWRP